MYSMSTLKIPAMSQFDANNCCFKGAKINADLLISNLFKLGLLQEIRNPIKVLSPQSLRILFKFILWRNGGPHRVFISDLAQVGAKSAPAARSCGCFLFSQHETFRGILRYKKIFCNRLMHFNDTWNWMQSLRNLFFIDHIKFFT